MRARTLLIQAVQALAVGPYDIRYRLWDAYYYFSQIRAGDSPEWLEQDFAWVMKTIFERKPKRPVVENPIQARLRSMRITTCVKIAKRISYIAERLRMIYEADVSGKPYMKL